MQVLGGKCWPTLRMDQAYLELRRISSNWCMVWANCFPKLPSLSPAATLTTVSLCHAEPSSFTLKLLFAQFSYLFLASLKLNTLLELKLTMFGKFLFPFSQIKFIFIFWKKKRLKIFEGGPLCKGIDFSISSAFIATQL